MSTSFKSLLFAVPRAKLQPLSFLVASLFVFAWFLPTTTAKSEALPPLTTVEHVDLNRYIGEWYEIASYPKWFSRGCVNSKATYELRSDGRVNVVNECHKYSADGRLSVAKGIARVVDESSNAKLKVRFGWLPFEGDYWIIDLGQDYEYAVVSEPGRDSLWILSRTESLPKELLDQILLRIRDVHKLDSDKLEFTRQ